MATSFPPRPYTSNLTRGGPVAGGPAQQQQQSAFGTAAPYHAQPSYGGPQPQHPAPGTFGVAAAGGPTAATQQQQQQREAQRFDRERHERGRREAEERDVLERLGEEHREEINEAFSLFDLDKDSYIDYHELKVALKALGFDVPKAELLDMLQTQGVPAAAAGSLSKNPVHHPPPPPPPHPTFTGPNRLLLSHASFVSIAAHRVLSRDPQEEILRAFELFDQGNKGRIDLQDLRRVAQELGEGLQEEELAAMIEEFDVRGEGGIGREEFVGICMGG